MSFSCPHYDINRDYCVRTRAACVPGRPGCVLQHNSTFAVPPALRIAPEPSSPMQAPAPAKVSRRGTSKSGKAPADSSAPVAAKKRRESKRTS
jgi:hypothetical protein